MHLNSVIVLLKYQLSLVLTNCCVVYPYQDWLQLDYRLLSISQSDINTSVLLPGVTFNCSGSSLKALRDTMILTSCRDRQSTVQWLSIHHSPIQRQYQSPGAVDKMDSLCPGALGLGAGFSQRAAGNED